MSTAPNTSLKDMVQKPSKTKQVLGGKYVTFYLGMEEYGVEILKVLEIIGLSPITPVPQTPDFIRGVINLRGRIVPIIDLQLKFGLEATRENRENCIVVVQNNGIETGILVDRMSEVLSIEESEIEDPPQLGASVNTDYVLGIDKSHGRVKLLLDIERVLSDQEFQSVSQAQVHSSNG